MPATLSILGLYNYDNSIFEKLNVPDHISKLDVVNNILFECAELELLYSDPDTMKTAIGIWSNIHLPTWQALQETLEYEYNPIWNVDGTETETHNLTNEHKKTGTDTQANSGTDTITNSGNDVSTDSGTDTDTKSVSGFNSSTFVNSDKIQTQHGKSTTLAHGLQTQTAHGKQEQTTYNSTDTIKDTGSITKLRQGNIGVTKTQDLIESQRKVVNFNVTDVITKEFKRKFCLLVY